MMPIEALASWSSAPKLVSFPPGAALDLLAMGEQRNVSDIGEQHTYGRMAAEEEQSVVSRDLLLVLLLILLLIAKGRIFTQHPSLKDLKAGELRC